MSIPTIAGSFKMTSDYSQLPFVKIKHFIVVKAQVDSIHGNFILDTGAKQLTLNQRLLHKNRQPNPKNTVLDISGTKRGVQSLNIKNFRWGPLVRNNFEALSIDLGSLEQSLDIPILGLIGYSALSQIEVHLDLRQSSIELFKIDAKGLSIKKQVGEKASQILPFHIVKYLPAVKADIEGKSLKLALDTGAASSILNNYLKQRLYSNALQQRTVRITGIFSNIQTAEACTFPEINLNKQLSVPFWKATFTDLSHLRDHGLYIDGIMNLSTLRFGKISINYRKKEFKCWHPIENMLLLDEQPSEAIPQDSTLSIKR